MVVALCPYALAVNVTVPVDGQDAVNVTAAFPAAFVNADVALNAPSVAEEDANVTRTFCAGMPLLKTVAVKFTEWLTAAQLMLALLDANVTETVGVGVAVGADVGVRVGVCVGAAVIVGVVVGVGVAPEPTTIETLPVRPSSVLPLIVAVMSLAPVL